VCVIVSRGSESSSSVHAFVFVSRARASSLCRAQSSVPRARRSTRVRRTARRVRTIAFVVMDAILAQMRAAQGIVEDVSDDDAQTAAGDEFGASTTTASTTPSAEAAYHRAMVSLCAEFASATKERLGGRWYSHFESWLYSRRERPDEPFPRGEDPRRDKELMRKLRAAGSTSGEAKYICKRLGKASEAARRNCLSAGAADARDKANRVRENAFEVGDGVRKIELACGKVKLEINERHYEKLRAMYARKTRAGDEDGFRRAAFCVLARYATMQGTHYKAGNMQASIPPRVFDVLRERFDVRCEMFASPFNAYFDEYCSACDATDAAFGSLGSAFDFEPESGSFECNPPFDEAIISKLAGHTERMLASRKDPLSFCVVVPKWTESQAWMRLAKSVYCTENVTLEAKEHAFVSGAQHARVDQLTASSAATSVIFLQNKAGKRQWPVTNDDILAIREAFAPPKRDSTRDVVEKWDPDAPLGGGRSTRRLPRDVKSWVYANSAGKKRTVGTEPADAEPKKRKAKSGGGLSASFFRE